MIETTLALVGFAALVAMVVLLLLDKSSPQVTFILISAFVGFLLVALESLRYVGVHIGIGEALGLKGGIFGLKELATFIKSGISSVAATAALFIFSILFFTILSAAGVFERIINALLHTTHNSVYGVMILTVLVACIAHLDGSGASSFLIAIPALLPIYEKMNIRKTTLMLILTASLGVMNLLPWGGPTLRVASITGVDATQLWIDIMPMQIVGLVLACALAIYCGFVETRRGAGAMGANTLETPNVTQSDSEFSRQSLFYPNLLILGVVLCLLVFSGLPSYFPFMLGASVALVVNYPHIKHQNEMMKEASAAAMMMATTLLAAGVLIGVFDKSGIMKLMAHLILDVMPHSLGGYLVILVGILAAPMALIFCTDSYFYGILPIVASVGEAFGIDAVTLGIAMVVCRNCATFISPVVPATLLGCGLAGVSIKDHIRNAFFWVWGISVVCLFSGIILGIIHV